MLGASLTFVLKSFLLVYACQLIFFSVTYCDNEISIFTKYSPRSGESVNLGDAHGRVAFAFMDYDTVPVEPDPRYITLKVMIAKVNQIYQPIELYPANLETVSREKHPEYFNKGSYADIVE